MALEYELSLAGETPVEQVAERALPDADERPTGTPPLLSADLYARYGFGVTVLADSDGYLEVQADDGRWEWEPGAYVSLTFRMDKDTAAQRSVINMLTVIRRVLATGPEDAALTLNGNELLFTRFDGNLVKHNHADWWSTYPGADDLITE
ncbi:SitI3 family protein [Actinoplanes sp. NPDC049681]|uniref:SitI3 family protein n=1 Tax=Actinoplanes sp. NPDC049681 TaxID=3363905 RepID=UPI00379603A5